MSYRIKEIYSHGQPSKYKAQKKYFNLVWITLKLVEHLILQNGIVK
jgi:uncharacterized membrane protein YsdA (DUF1294 family)